MWRWSSKLLATESGSTDGRLQLYPTRSPVLCTRSHYVWQSDSLGSMRHDPARADLKSMQSSRAEVIKVPGTRKRLRPQGLTLDHVLQGLPFPLCCLFRGPSAVYGLLIYSAGTPLCTVYGPLRASDMPAVACIWQMARPCMRTCQDLACASPEELRQDPRFISRHTDRDPCVVLGRSGSKLQLPYRSWDHKDKQSS